jgi:hypothetical protein
VGAPAGEDDGEVGALAVGVARVGKTVGDGCRSGVAVGVRLPSSGVSGNVSGGRPVEVAVAEGGIVGTGVAVAVGKGVSVGVAVGVSVGVGISVGYNTMGTGVGMPLSSSQRAWTSW